jgi:hypothetical protein
VDIRSWSENQANGHQPALTFIGVVDDSDKSVLSLWLAVIGCTLLPCGCENSGGYAAVLMQKMLS